MLNIDHALGWPGGTAVPLDRPVAHWQLEARAQGGPGFNPPPVQAVFGCLLNHRAALDALGDAVHLAPYQVPPKAPVLYIKPRNCRVGHGAAVIVPGGVDTLEMGATLGVVIGRSAWRVSEAEAMSCVAGYTVCNDVSVPHASYYRPSLRFRCRDSFLPIGPWIVGARHVAAPDALSIRVEIDGRLAQQATTGGMHRPVARLLADVSEFMTLSPGDVLMLGVPFGAPLARAGQRVRIHIEGVGTLENPLRAEDAA